MGLGPDAAVVSPEVEPGEGAGAAAATVAGRRKGERVGSERQAEDFAAERRGQRAEQAQGGRGETDASIALRLDDDPEGEAHAGDEETMRNQTR